MKFLQDPHVLIILFSVIIILSYLFNLVSKRTNIPAVLLLIVTGIIIQQGLIFLNLGGLDFFPILEILGIVGLILIVLEAALELELKKEKWPIIWKSMSIALIGLISSIFAIAFIFQLTIGADKMDFLHSLLYAVPLSILSSAIVIPSVQGLREHKREFHVYESTFSDIFGIMAFYFVLGLMEPSSGGNPAVGFLSNLLLTIVISVFVSYGLVFVFQKIESNVKFFLLIAILLLEYAIGKLFHLSSLIIILVFGLIISNYKLFFQGFLKKWVHEGDMKEILKDFHVVTAESAFVVRTFFFVIFGITIVLADLNSMKVVLTSGGILLVIYLMRFLFFKLFFGKDIFPQVNIAPRGLITVLLFFAIPKDEQVAEFESGILLFIIIATSLIMTFSLIRNGKKQSMQPEAEGAHGEGDKTVEGEHATEEEEASSETTDDTGHGTPPDSTEGSEDAPENPTAPAH